jgi:aryl-alcohol dehydrogenase-like predicted oxidoreductase
MTNTQLQKTKLGIGTWAWGDSFFWGWGRGGYGLDDLKAATAACVAAGVTLFDTAEVYGMGRSERILGRLALDSLRPLQIASKCFPFPYRFSPRALSRALKNSLARLQRDKIELYQMHWPFAPVSIRSWMNAMADAVEAGLIDQVGVSNYNARQLEAAYTALAERGIHLASNQISYSLMHRRPELNGLIRLCQDLGITVIAYSPIAQGLLTGKYSRRNPPGGPRRFRYGSAQLELAERLVDETRRIGASYGGKTPVQVALNWCIAKGTLPIPGVKNRRQADEVLGALGWQLSDADVAKLDELED